MSKSTMVELVVELEARALLLDDPKAYDHLISEAKAGEYHDFKNNKHVCGKVALVVDLDKFPELSDIREAVKNGDYDESPDEEDKAMMRKDLGDNPELLKALGLE